MNTLNPINNWSDGHIWIFKTVLLLGTEIENMEYLRIY